MENYYELTKAEYECVLAVNVLSNGSIHWVRFSTSHSKSWACFKKKKKGIREENNIYAHS